MKNLVFETKEFMFPIRVWQTKSGFTVEYGLQVRRGLTLREASNELGSSLMHLMSCEGRIDNEAHSFVT